MASINAGIVPHESTLENLERIARCTKVFVSMPYVKGITPKALLEKGRREAPSASGGAERWHGIFQPDEIGLPAFDHGLLYGDGVFEGLLVVQGRIFQWQEHLQRLFESARRLQIQVPYTPLELTQHVQAASRGDEADDWRPTYLRLVVTRGVGDLGINPGKCAGSTVYCIASQIQLYPESFYEQGLQLALARYIRRTGADTLDPQIKACNYLNNILALLETCGTNTQETLLLTQEGYVAEATTDNLFLVVRNTGWENDPGKVTVMTPAAGCCLKGITRELVLGYARAQGHKVIESIQMTPGDLTGENKEAFLTGTGAGLVPVVMFDGRSVGDGKPGPITRKFRQLLDLDLADPALGLRVDAGEEELMRYLDALREPQAMPMTPEFVRVLFQTIDSRDWENLDRVFSEDIVYERPGYPPLVGFKRVEKFYREERVIASGTHILEGAVVNDNAGASWGRFVGMHKNGSAIDERFADAYTFCKGKIKTRKSYFFRPAV
jgi:branched-chain amino acid aminotransferase